MDAKSKASFINSVAVGQTVPCPRCGTANRPGAANCTVCGTQITANAASGSTPAFASVANASASGKSVKYTEPAAVFADGLPAWDILPPQVMVRRR